MIQSFIARKIQAFGQRLMHRLPARRPPDYVIRRVDGDEYLRRWFVIPRNRFLNIYLHQFLLDDDDCALHDHPWISMSVLLKGSYFDVTAVPDGECFARFSASYPQLILRGAEHTHRIVLERDHTGRPIDTLTLFITGPRIRTWGFRCPQGWRSHHEFKAKNGCGG